VAAKKKTSSKKTSVKKATSNQNMGPEDRIANAKRLDIIRQLSNEINSLGPRSTAPRQPGKPPAPSAQYRGLANVRDALTNNSLRGVSFVSRGDDAKGSKGTGRSIFRGRGRGSARGTLGIFGNRVIEN